ncbi:hypothetical protein Dimus_011876 [Dionaea muscipula]
MEAMNTEPSHIQEPPSPVPSFDFARSYQIEALERAIRQNTIVYLETGSGKTLIAIMLLRLYSHLIRKPSSYIAVFLVPTVVLVGQQAGAIRMSLDLKVGEYYGEMNVDYWDAAIWNKEQEKHEVLVMTPMVLLNALRHSYIKLNCIKVLIFDECHNARGRHPYACIMKEFYHRQLHDSSLPRILGMTASPIKAKGCLSSTYWKQISELENLLNSKVYTCESESVLAVYIPFATVKLKFYDGTIVSNVLSNHLSDDLERLIIKHKSSPRISKLKNSAKDSLFKRFSGLKSTFLFCLSELGLWLALKAAEFFGSRDTSSFFWGDIDIDVKSIISDFALDVFKLMSSYLPSGSEWSVCENMKANAETGILTRKVVCLVESLLEYWNFKSLRCIIFVERVITSVVLRGLLSTVLPKLCGWNTEYIAGNNKYPQTQSRKEQNKIVEEFRKGMINIIVATSILEEGLDVQSCNLVIRFDPSATVCSFIQSKGRARMQNSDFLIMVKSGDAAELSRVENYKFCGDVMRRESLSHATIPCEPAQFDSYDEIFYRVESTGAIVTLSSSVSLIYFYCSRLPSDGYFKPSPVCTLDNKSGSCTIQFPHSCPIPSVSVQGSGKMLKQSACLEACKQLHQIGALTDHLVPDVVVEEALVQENEKLPYSDNHACFVAPELVSNAPRNSSVEYYCYMIKMERNFPYDVSLHDIVLLLKSELDYDVGNIDFDLEADRGNIDVHMRYVGRLTLTNEQVLLSTRFQVAIFRVLLEKEIQRLMELLGDPEKDESFAHLDYLLLPCVDSPKSSLIIDWSRINFELLCYNNITAHHTSCPLTGVHLVHTKNGLVCSCMLEDCLVYTPHNNRIYGISGFLRDLNYNSHLELRNGELISYKNYFKRQHGLDLQFDKEGLLCGRRIFAVENYLQRSRQPRNTSREPSHGAVELPPELCSIIMTPLSISILYTYSFVPSIMHWIESLLLSSNLKKMVSDHCMQTIDIPAIKVLEAITTRKCQERLHLESMETLGDSFLKYAVSQRLFTTFENNHEGLLSLKREQRISNAALFKLGLKNKIPGFIRTEPFDPRKWGIPSAQLEEEVLSPERKIYTRGSRMIKSKTVADVVEALIGAYLSAGSEQAALYFMNWLGIDVNIANLPYKRQISVIPSSHVNVPHLEALLNYSFNDSSLLVEALTHGSFMLPGYPRCYQRLEFLGDAVLDHLITVHLYTKFPGLSPGLLTDLRSASVNNDCYAQSALRAGLHKHIFHASQELHKHLRAAVHAFEQLSLDADHGWDTEISFPKVLADIIESLAGAILVDSGYNKETVFRSLRPLLEPLVTPEAMKLHPVKELQELCDKHGYQLGKPLVSSNDDGLATMTLEVKADSVVVYSHTCIAKDKKTAKRIASKALVKCLKDSISAL